MKAMDNTTVLSYIHKQGGNEQGETHSHTLFPLVVDQVLFFFEHFIDINNVHTFDNNIRINYINGY